MVGYELSFCSVHSILGEEASWIEIDCLELHPEVIFRLAELGLVEVNDGRMRLEQVERLYKVVRLRRDLGINLQGAGVILDLLARIEALEAENRHLRWLVK